MGEQLLNFLLSVLRGPVKSAKDFDKVWPIFDSWQSRDLQVLLHQCRGIKREERGGGGGEGRERGPGGVGEGLVVGVVAGGRVRPPPPLQHQDPLPRTVPPQAAPMLHPAVASARIQKGLIRYVYVVLDFSRKYIQQGRRMEYTYQRNIISMTKLRKRP